jgi:3-dehydroquinate dehydratase-2
MGERDLKILVIQGPNLDQLGQREESHYGNFTLKDVHELLEKEVSSQKITLSFYQSNHEGELIEKIHAAGSDFDGILINAAGFTHTSVAIRDALIIAKLPFVEVHLSNPYAREDFRHQSYLSDLAIGVVCGFKEKSYVMGLEGLVQFFRKTEACES